MDITLQPLEKPEKKHGLDVRVFDETRRDKDILKTMDEDTYEELIASWTYWCFKVDGESQYEDVMRIGGAGDGGIDVIAFRNQSTNDCDIFQCKHYNHPINRSDVIAELGKFLYHVFCNSLINPKSYYLMAPQNLSGKFTSTYTIPENLKSNILASWNKDIASKIEAKETFPLEGDLKAFVEGFDYSKFKIYSTDKMLADLHNDKNRHIYHQYFGIKKEEIVLKKITTPEETTDYESHYIQHLMDAYNDEHKSDNLTIDSLDGTKYNGHFHRSRDQFWIAESVRKLSEEIRPGDVNEFCDLEDDMIHHIADKHEEEYDNAFLHVKAVTDKATSLSIKSQSLISGYLGSGALKGVCFQLSNEDRLIWKEKNLNGTFEMALRLLAILTTCHKSFTVERIAIYSYFCIYLTDYNSKENSVHPAIPFRNSNYINNKQVINNAIEMLLSKGLIEPAFTNSGLMIQSSKMGDALYGRIESAYKDELVRSINRTHQLLSQKTDEMLKDIVYSNISKWGSEFINESILREFYNEE